MEEITAVFKMIVVLISGKGGAAAIGALVALALVAASKNLPKILGKFFTKELDSGIDRLDKIKDPKRKELIENIVYDLVIWAEYEFPDAGQGRVRFDKVASLITAAVPVLRGQDKLIADLIEKSVSKMDEAFKKKIADRKK